MPVTDISDHRRNAAMQSFKEKLITTELRQGKLHPPKWSKISLFFPAIREQLIY
jgi:hypothetical protein